MKKLQLKTIPKLLLLSGALISTSNVFASAFQLWEQDGASVGLYHAGYAAQAADASTAFYNPAGLTLLKNQQMVLSSALVMPNVKYRGILRINTLDGNDPQTVTAQGGKFAAVPAFHFVKPINQTLAFGFSVAAPFGASLEYGHDSVMQYAATTTKIMVVDLSPSLGVQLTDKASIGFGPDFQIAKGEFDQVGVLGFGSDVLTGDGVNDLKSYAWGYHAGWLYQFTPQSRLGLSYHSQTVHHMRGRSTLDGSLLEFGGEPPIDTDKTRLNITFPPYAAMSYYQHFDSGFSVMGSVIYTKWNVLREFVLQNVAVVEGGVTNDHATVVTQNYFKNSWNISIGADYQWNDKIKLRTGVGFDQSPVQDRFRTVRIPDNDRYVFALGGQYHLNKTIDFDAAWSHFFIKNAYINPPVQLAGDEEITTVGRVKAGADVLAFQVTWNIDA